MLTFEPLGIGEHLCHEDQGPGDSTVSSRLGGTRQAQAQPTLRKNHHRESRAQPFIHSFIQHLLDICSASYIIVGVEKNIIQIRVHQKLII